MELSDLQNRFGFHSGARQSKALEFDRLRSTAFGFAVVIDSVLPDSREKSLAVTELEAALMWATKGVALLDNTPDPIPSPAEE